MVVLIIKNLHNFLDYLSFCKVIERRGQCLADQGDLEAAEAELGEQDFSFSNDTNQ